jgi:hypothetical protein
VEGPLPGTDVNSVMDYDDSEKKDDATVGDESHAIEGTDAKCTGEHQCLVCKHKKKIWVRAEYICVECGRIYFCHECDQVHGRNKATKDHHVIHLNTVEEKGVNCGVHDQLMKKYCSTCNEPVCPLCILLEHDDHTFREIREVFHELVKEIESGIEEHEKMARELRNVEIGLKGLRQSTFDRRDDLLNAVEDHSEKCIEQILRQKKALKVRIRTRFNADDVAACLNRIPALVNSLNDSVGDAKDVLSKRDLGPVTYLERLNSTKENMEECRRRTQEISGQPYWNRLEKIHENAFDFVPVMAECKIGTFEEHKVKEKRKQPFDKYVVVFEQRYTVDNKEAFIPSVVSLDNGYAVAHPTAGAPSDAIDIYTFPGTLNRTLREHVHPLHQMTKSSDGKLLVLSEGTTVGSYCIKRFDAESGFLGSTAEFVLKGTPLSFDVNPRHQYVILCKNGDRRELMILRGDGTVVLSQAVDPNPIVDMHSIACVGNNCVIGGRNGIIVYAAKQGRMQLVTIDQGQFGATCKVKHISATGLCINFSYYGKSVNNSIGRAVLYNDCLLGWAFKHYIGKPADVESRISESGNYIVASFGHTVRVLTVDEQ